MRLFLIFEYQKFKFSKKNGYSAIRLFEFSQKNGYSAIRLFHFSKKNSRRLFGYSAIGYSAILGFEKKIAVSGYSAIRLRRYFDICRPMVTDSRKNGPYFGTKKWGPKKIKFKSNQIRFFEKNQISNQIKFHFLKKIKFQIKSNSKI